MTSYEAKCEFIGSYVDTITIKEHKDRRNKIIQVDIADLKIKPNKVNKLLDYNNTNMLDEIVGNGVYKASVSQMKHEKDALEYIDLLKEKHKFVVFTFSKDDDFYLNTQLFKLIHIKPKSVVEEEKVFALFLAETTNIVRKYVENGC